ncbi:uncharacterized protein LOC117801514 [Ailuropoda melanoleuca]|uniref:uncharacterized protein LOC117801514 n=1 Tax=Ailuropoda melanoleuca TaxID=9646 RepID=UPI0014949513|nr:uncharacterized protein LOC117801514 [Ailuropoda melanoleuca]
MRNDNVLLLPSKMCFPKLPSVDLTQPWRNWNVGDSHWPFQQAVMWGPQGPSSWPEDLRNGICLDSLPFLLRADCHIKRVSAHCCFPVIEKARGQSLCPSLSGSLAHYPLQCKKNVCLKSGMTRLWQLSIPLLSSKARTPAGGPSSAVSTEGEGSSGTRDDKMDFMEQLMK